MSNWLQVDEILQSGLTSGVYTAAVLLAGRAEEVAYEKAVGRLTIEPDSLATTLETVFDLASLTKTLATSLALLLLVQRGRVSLAATLGELLPVPWLPADKTCLPLVSLLTHQSGLPAWKPFYDTVLTLPVDQRPGSLERLAATAPLEHTPGPLTIYSDLGFMLLKAVVETISGEDLDAFCRRHLYEPLGLKNMGFKPIAKSSTPSSKGFRFSYPLSPGGERVRVRGESGLTIGNGLILQQQPGAQNKQYAATEVGLISGRTIQGEVHDENAWSAGGVAGHAGLFGIGHEVFQLAAQLYQAFTVKTADSFFDPQVVRTFLTPPTQANRALGFDVPGPRDASCGRMFSPRSVGHLGFTGVSYWIDLHLGQIVVLLTNRVHLGRDNDTIRPFRPRVYEAASRALGFSQLFRG
jgi:serine-type D-Ala-D-Ala carboxypeptidase